MMTVKNDNSVGVGGGGDDCVNDTRPGVEIRAIGFALPHEI